MTRRYKSKALAAVHEAMSDLHAERAIDDATLGKFNDMCLAPEGGTAEAAGLAFAVFTDAKGYWRWRLVSADGKRIAGSGQGYKTKAACLAAIELVRKATSAPVAA